MSGLRWPCVPRVGGAELKDPSVVVEVGSSGVVVKVKHRALEWLEANEFVVKAGKIAIDIRDTDVDK